MTVRNWSQREQHFNKLDKLINMYIFGNTVTKH